MKKLAVVLALLMVSAANVSLQHIRLTESGGESEFPDLAFDGSRLAVAWMDGRDGNQEIYLNTASFTTMSKGAERRLTSSATWDVQPHLTWTGSEYGLTWIHESKTKFNLYFQKFSPDLSPSGRQVTIISQAWLGKETDICFTGAGFGLVYSEFMGAETSDIKFQYLDDAGAKQGQAVTLTSGPGIKVPGAFIRAGADFGLFYWNTFEGNVYFVRIDPFGNPRSAPLKLNFEGTRAAGAPAAAVGAAAIMAAWPQQAEFGQQIICRPLSLAGAPAGDPSPVSQPGPSRPSVTVAAGPDHFGVAWIDLDDQGRSLHFIAINPQAAKLMDSTRLSKPLPSKVMCNQIDMLYTMGGYVLAWVDVAPPMNTEVILSKINLEVTSSAPLPAPAPAPGSTAPPPPPAAAPEGPVPPAAPPAGPPAPPPPQ